MAKRWTDTDKWKDDWYVALPNDYRIVWQWLLDNCNHAAICKRSIVILNRDCRTSLSEEEMIRIMEGRVLISRNIWFIPNFLRFQYNTLHSKKPAIITVCRDLTNHNLWSMIPKSFGNDYLMISESLLNSSETIKDMDIDTDIDTLLGGNSIITDNSNSNAHEEKNVSSVQSEDQPKQNGSPPYSFTQMPWQSDQFKSAWNDWLLFRKGEFESPYRRLHGEQQALMGLVELAGQNEAKAIETIRWTMSNRWKNFRLKVIDPPRSNGKHPENGKVILKANH